MERTIIKELYAWKNRTERQPLILKGARQCGKTYILKKFGDEYYRHTAYFNFEETSVLAGIFEKDFDTKRIIFELSLQLGRSITPEDTLVVFDEIQICGRAVTALKYFSENAPEYNIVCAGSLLGISLQPGISFPVGKVEFLDMYPMSFTEFAAARGENTLAEFLQGINRSSELPAVASGKAETLLNEYYIVGGMPAAVKKWCETMNLDEVESVQRNILQSYEMDFAKHAPIEQFTKLTAIWRSIPVQLAKENKKFIFSQVKKGWRAKDLEDALEWLIDAGLIYKVRRIEKPAFPLSSYADDTAFKIYMCDVGLLRCLSGLPYSAMAGNFELYSEFKGAMAENYVLCEFLKAGQKEAFFWTSGNSAEVDFVIQEDNMIIPVEVKASQNVRARSLAEYRKKYKPELAMKISGVDKINGKEVLNFPLYAAGEAGKLCCQSTAENARHLSLTEERKDPV